MKTFEESLTAAEVVMEAVTAYIDELAALSATHSFTKWARGDCLLRAREELGENFSTLLDHDMLPEAESTWRQEMWVAGRFEPWGPLRRVGASWSLHRLVCAAALAPHAQGLLDRAERERWGYRQMEREVQAILTNGESESLGGGVLSLDPDNMTREEYTAAVVAHRCGDVPPQARSRVMVATIAAIEEWERGAE